MGNPSKLSLRLPLHLPLPLPRFPLHPPLGVLEVADGGGLLGAGESEREGERDLGVPPMVGESDAASESVPVPDR